MPASLPGFLTLPEAIQRIGPHVQAEWTGSEHVAPSAREDAAELLALVDVDAAQLEREEAAWVRNIKRGAEQQRERQRAAGVPPSGTAEAITKINERVLQINDPNTRACLERVLEILKNSQNKRYRRRPANAEARANNIRHRLVNEAFGRQKANAARRQRWNRVHALIRDKVFAGDLEAAAELPNGEVIYPAAEHWKAGWPAAGEALAHIPYLGFEWLAEVLLAEVDLDNTFRMDTPGDTAAQAAPDASAAPATTGIAKKTSVRGNLEYREALYRYITHPSAPNRLAASDMDIARGFRRNVKNSSLKLPRKTRLIANQVSAIRKELSKATDDNAKRTAAKSS